MPFNPDDLKKNTNAVSLTTYATEEDLRGALLAKQAYIQGVAYIRHDKDNKEPHTHIQIVLKRSRRLSDVIGWFKNCRDEKGELANTLGEITLSCRAMEEYFTHSDEESRAAGKHQYVEEDIKCLEQFALPWDFETAHDRQVSANQKKREAQAETEALLQDIIDGVPQREMARRYGRDYMKNFKTYRAFAGNVVLEEEGDIEKALLLQDDIVKNTMKKEAREHYERGVFESLTTIERMMDEGSSHQQILKVIRAFKEAKNE